MKTRWKSYWELRSETSVTAKGIEARRYYVHGRVQGVGFRWFVQRAAEDFVLTGYTRNLDDGRVEVYAVGSPQKLADLAGRLWKGPPGADVRGVEEHEAAVQQYGSFRIEG